MFMAVDQYGTTFHGLTHPRKDLLKKFGAKHASRIYRDKEGGGRVHVGYVIGERWLTLYEVIPFEKDA